MKVLLSIKPEFVEKIFSGEKQFEYRRSIFKNPNVDTIIVYSTMPVGKIVGEFKIQQILNLNIEELWTETQSKSGLNYSFYKSYFHDKDMGYAIKIDNVKEYKKPLSLSQVNKDLKAPQSFCYINDDLILA
ncbi:ASCH domain-containing protein [Lysinibacillus fusiformis]|uniref:ASCH domain-containing protein n=1 Tax=Lysinibacillus fusiformis TaxID=28031 RepID=UPI00148D8145|nr:ASCH domain-containing protein [Lysinibacillus fusiformis]NOG26603.1 ASCH domain-containing protein [Lysinibacillus fusiformis]